MIEVYETAVPDNAKKSRKIGLAVFTNAVLLISVLWLSARNSGFCLFILTVHFVSEGNIRNDKNSKRLPGDQVRVFRLFFDDNTKMISFIQLTLLTQPFLTTRGITIP